MNNQEYEELEKNLNKNNNELIVKYQSGATSYTKHCFWINNSYIKKIFEEFN